MTNYFQNCKSSEDLKATYKQLVKKYHPDIYGVKGNEILKEIHNQLEKAVKNIDVNYKAFSNYLQFAHPLLSSNSHCLYCIYINTKCHLFYLL